jgi:DNA-binding MarR family transcriptional regulator
MSKDVRWLNDEEQCLWRRWLRLNAQLNATLQREMQDESGLSSPDFEVLVNLTDSPEGRVRVSDLACQMVWERSRLSHHVTRMERRGLVRRAGCAEDGRGAFIEITAEGRTAIEQAAPGHVETVRRLMFDVLSEDDTVQLERLVAKLLAGLDAVEGSPVPETIPETAPA